MARPQKPLDAMSKNLTKAEIEAKQNKEKALEKFEKLSKTPPKYLSDIAKTEYKKVYKLIQHLPVAQLDQQTLITYCELYSDYREVLEEITALKVILDNDYDLVIDKQLTTKRRQKLEILREMKSVGNMLGMSIDSRLKLVPAETNEEDEFLKAFGDA